MSETPSSSGDADQQPDDDEEEESAIHGAVQVPRLEDLCRAQAHANMRDSTWRTLVSNLPEEAHIGVSNTRHLLMTSLDIRKAFSPGHNLDRFLEGNSCTACKAKVYWRTCVSSGMHLHWHALSLIVIVAFAHCCSGSLLTAYSVDRQGRSRHQISAFQGTSGPQYSLPYGESLAGVVVLWV